jgi:hypothetical protein
MLAVEAEVFCAKFPANPILDWRNYRGRYECLWCVLRQSESDGKQRISVTRKAWERSGGDGGAREGHVG